MRQFQFITDLGPQINSLNLKHTHIPCLKDSRPCKYIFILSWVQQRMNPADKTVLLLLVLLVMEGDYEGDHYDRCPPLLLLCRCPTCRSWWGRASRTWARHRRRSAACGRLRRSWRSNWTPPGPESERPATCWLTCRWARASRNTT